MAACINPPNVAGLAAANGTSNFTASRAASAASGKSSVAASVCASNNPVLINFQPTNSIPTGGCLLAPYGSYGFASPYVCDGLTPFIATTNGWAGEYSNIVVASNNTYVFSSVLTYQPTTQPDYITIGDDTGTIIYAAGFTPLTWVSNTTGNVRFYTHIDQNCGTSSQNRTRQVTCKGNPLVTIVPTTGLFTDDQGTIPYTGGLTASVYARPTVSTIYAVNALNGKGCPVTATLASKKIRGGSGFHLAVGILLSFGYIILSRLTFVFATKGDFSPVLAAWLPNIIFGLIAFYLYKKAPK